jgi:hypothetical protein
MWCNYTAFDVNQFGDIHKGQAQSLPFVLSDDRGLWT